MSPQEIVRTFYKGEIAKLVIMVVLVVLILTQLSVLILPFLTGLVGASLALWLVPLILTSRASVVVE